MLKPVLYTVNGKLRKQTRLLVHNESCVFHTLKIDIDIKWQTKEVEMLLMAQSH